MSQEEAVHPREARLIQPFTLGWFALVFGAALAYAILRYHVFKGVAWEHFPLYILNKAVSLAAVFFIALAYLIGKVVRVYSDAPAKRLILIKFCGLTGASLAMLHILMSLLIFSAAYYEKFFHAAGGAAGKLNLVGELSMLFGVLAAWCLAVTTISSLPRMYESFGEERWLRSQRLGYLALTFVGGHVLVMGWSGWLLPGDWPGSMPPISLVAFAAAAITIAVKLATSKKHRGVAL